MQWALWKKGLPEVLLKAVMSLYESSKTKVKVGSEVSEEFSVTIAVYIRDLFHRLCCWQLWWML